MKITENECCMVISKNWADCPQCWCNFVRSLELPEHDTDWERTRSINDGLVEYSARREEGIRAVFFATHVHKTWFIMRWS